MDRVENRQAVMPSIRSCSPNEVPSLGTQEDVSQWRDRKARTPFVCSKSRKGIAVGIRLRERRNHLNWKCYSPAESGARQ